MTLRLRLSPIEAKQGAELDHKLDNRYIALAKTIENIEFFSCNKLTKVDGDYRKKTYNIISRTL